MPSSTTLTVRFDSKVEEHVSRFADAMRRTRSEFAAESVAASMVRKTQIIESFHRGLAGLEEISLTPHDDAMAEVDAASEAMARSRERSGGCLLA